MKNELEHELFIEQPVRPESDVQPELRNSQDRPQPLPRKNIRSASSGHNETEHTQSPSTDDTVATVAGAEETDRPSSPSEGEDQSQCFYHDNGESAPPLPPKVNKSRSHDIVDQTSTAEAVEEFDGPNVYETLSFERNQDDLTDTDICIGSMFDPNRFLFKKTRFEIDLLLIGKTGQGKSELGNSILGRKVFESRPSMTSVTKSVTYDLSEYNGKVIKVVDGPGVCDTDMNVDEAKSFVVESLSYAIALNPKGYHAFLLVVKFGERFTHESRLTIEVLKKVFGKNFVKDYCILVMTHGDLFVGENSFRDWLNEQKGALMDLVKECGDRIILYDNRAKEKEKREGLLNTLLDMVQMLALEKCRYTDEQFEEARLSREAMMLESRKSSIEEEAMIEASLILKKLQSLQADTENFNKSINHASLQLLLGRTITLVENLIEQDKKSGVLHEMISHVQSLQNSINDEIRLARRISKLIKSDKPEIRKAVTRKILLRKSTFRQILTEGSVEDNAMNQNKDPEPNLPEAHVEEISIMNEQWEKTRLLEAQQKKMKHKKNRKIFRAIQGKICAALNIKLKEKRKGFK